MTESIYKLREAIENGDLATVKQIGETAPNLLHEPLLPSAGRSGYPMTQPKSKDSRTVGENLMQVTFLGTSAAPSMPIPFCVCQACSDARRAAGKNLRNRSSIAINDDLLVDIGPDIATASFAHDVPLTGIRVCLLTHAHADHFDPEFLMSRHEEYATVVAQEMLLAGSSDALRSIDEVLGGRCEYGSIFAQDTQRALKINLLIVEPFKTQVIGDYRFTGYPANHGTEKGCLLYAIEQGQYAIFYGTDTSVLSEQVWEHLLLADTQFDLLVLDHTYGIGFDASPPDHLASVDVIGHVDRFRRSDLLKDNGTAYATHISHEGCLEHDELDEYAAAHGYRVAFDGLSLSFDT